MGKMNVILLEGEVKGYHERPLIYSKDRRIFCPREKIGFAAAQVNDSAKTFGQVLVGLL